jgi:2-dehydro-3-deoxygalactonokinase
MNDSSMPRLGIDWGTSNRRAYLLDGRGELIRQHDDDAGILKVDGSFSESLKELLAVLELDSADVIMSGMVGSRNGWHQVPYLTIEQPLSRLHEALVEIDSGLPNVRCRIVPGYEYMDVNGFPDVMRGEETQVLGTQELSASSGWFLLPGTHSKWVRMEDSCIREFLTFMTGEFYALVSQHGTLAKIMAGQASVPSAFEDGLRAAALGTLTHMAFCCRARVVTDRMPAEHAASYISGLLIGTELNDILERTGGTISSPVQVIGSPALAARYLSALEFLGISARAWQPDGVYLAALHALFNHKR